MIKNTSILEKNESEDPSSISESSHFQEFSLKSRQNLENSQKLSFSKQISSSLDPFRNTKRLKNNITRLNETLFNKGASNIFFKQLQNNEKTKQETNKEIIEKVKNTKKKLRIEQISKETKLNKKLQDFKKMDTFFDIQKFLKEFNILEDPEFREFLAKLKANLKEYRIKRPLFIEKNENSSKIETVLAHSREKIQEFYSQSQRKVLTSSLNENIQNYLLNDKQNQQNFNEETENELDFMTNIWKNKLMSLNVIAKNDNEGNYFDTLAKDIVDFETLQQTEEIKKMLIELGINLDDKSNEIFKNSNDIYYKKFHQKADKLRAYMDRVIKEIFKKKWIERHNLKSSSEISRKNFEFSQTLLENDDKKSVFLTNIKEQPNNSSTTVSTLSLESKLKKKLERIMNSKAIFPFLPANFEEKLPKLLPTMKLNRSLTCSLIDHKGNQTENNALKKYPLLKKLNNFKDNSSITSTKLIELDAQNLGETRKKAKTMHVKFNNDSKIRNSILEFNKISNDALKEHRKSLRKSRKSVYFPTNPVNPDLQIDFSNIKKFDEIMGAIKDRNQMVSKFQKFLNYVDFTKDNYEKNTAVCGKNISNIIEDMDILQEKVETPIVEALRDEVYTNEYVEARNKWYKKNINKNLKKTIRLVLSQKS